MKHNSFDVIIIGAGAAGLMAALEIALTGRTVGLIEAKDRCGGRMHTVLTNDYPVELGAEFVHGDLPVTLGLLKKAGVKTLPVSGSFWRYQDGHLVKEESQIEDENDLEKKFGELKTDMPVAEFISTYLDDDKYKELRLTLRNYVKGYYAADPAKSSTVALREELEGDDHPNYRIVSGYQALVDYFEKQCREKGVHFFLSETVQDLQWSNNNVEAVTTRNVYSATKAIITVSIGVLSSGSLVFSPTLPEKTAAAKKLGFGHVIKIIFQFKEAFWKDQHLTSDNDLSDLNFLFSQETIPTWWTQHPKKETVLVGWLAGPGAEEFQLDEKDEIEKKAIYSLSRIFNLDVVHLSQKLLSSHFYNWQADANFCGAYSYEVVGGEALQKIILQPVENTIYFAGEGLHHGSEIGTVEAALQSGQTVARELITQF